MTELEKALAFNSQTKEAILTIYNALNHGQKKQIEKAPAANAVLERYGIKIDDDKIYSGLITED